MKIIKEEVEIDRGRSFRVFSPRLRNCFYWHYHPEVELVYVEATNGIRHVGKHVSGFVGSDLVLIGTGVPHLNFDYGIDTEYHQIVVQFREGFLEDAVGGTPEFDGIRRMLERSHLGLAFHGRTKAEAVKRLKAVDARDRFGAYLGIVGVLQLLAHAGAEAEELNREDTRLRWFLNDKIRMGTIYDYIRQHYDKKPDVSAIADMVHLSTSAFCRYFKRHTDMTFTDFVNQYRINVAKTYLLREETIAEVCYKVGYESISYFNKLFKQLTGETPSAFKNRHRFG